MSQGNLKANTHEEQDRILDSKQEENVESGKKKTLSNWATVQIFMRNTMLSHNQRETEAISNNTA